MTHLCFKSDVFILLYIVVYGIVSLGGAIMKKTRELNTKESVKVVTSNSFITACGLEDLSLKGRKLLYLAISQCRKTDTEFFEYSISVKSFADMMDIQANNVYSIMEYTTDELMRTFIKYKDKNNTRKYSLFSLCEYNDTTVRFKLNPDMTEFLLELKGNFSQPLLAEFVRMRSPYSISIWHLMQREMKSQKPYADHIIEFDLSLEELREITGTEKKLKKLSDFKIRVLDKALKEIDENCNVVIKYENVKQGRKVIGFHFIAKSKWYR